MAMLWLPPLGVFVVALGLQPGIGATTW